MRLIIPSSLFFRPFNYLLRLLSLRLNGWYGRTGNNIQQICIGLISAQRINASFMSIDHPIIRPIKYGSSKHKFLFYGRFFFFLSNSNPRVDVTLTAKEVNEKMNSIGIKQVFPAVKNPPLEILPHDTLVIHLRGGDVYDLDADNRDYVQNPVDFFRKLIKRFSRTIVVYEKLKNGRPHPVLEELLSEDGALGRNITTQSSTVEADFRVLLSARHLASSGVGTFALGAAIISPNLEKLYCTNLYLSLIHI